MSNLNLPKKIALFCLILLAMTGAYFLLFQKTEKKPGAEVKLVTAGNDINSNEEEHEGYDGPEERGQLEIYKTMDPAIGRVPIERLWTAVKQADAYKQQFGGVLTGRMEAVAWTERGPISDIVGPSNGNSRGQISGSAPNTNTSGRIRAVLIDANDATGNTVWVGGVAGGVWKTTNFLSASPTWNPVNDLFSNLAVSSICQNPANPNIMYFATGEPTNNSDAVLGAGVWRSADAGATWAQLGSTTGAAYQRTFKVICDATGNVYLALRGNGFRRSTDQGANWSTITPSSAVSASCTDVEVSSTGRLHISMGYNTASGSPAAQYFYTDNPSTVTTGTWSTGTGLPTAVNGANRLELACLGNVVYAVPTIGSATASINNTPYAIYRSADGGANWTRQNVADFTAAQLANQGWYDLSLGIDPTDANDIIIGGLDAYRSTDGGVNISRLTFWVGAGAYVHADHHEVIYRFTGGENRIIMACDGGIFLSRNDGSTFADKNVGLRLKQFYSGILHPNSTTNPNYMIGGAQDNGTHQINAAGLTSSIEVTGGDGAYVDISPAAPTIHWGAYVFNRYRLSLTTGATWSAVDWGIPGDFGRFINPFVYDGTSNVIYGAGNLDYMLRVTNANLGVSGSANLVTLSGLFQPSAFKLSPYNTNVLYVGSGPGSFSASGARLYRVANANSIGSGTVGDGNVTNLTSASWSTNWYLNCINVGTNENNLVATFTNYGINNIWVTTNGGTSWTAVDGNLPDMPVRWAIFPPGDNTKMIIATEAGVYTTNLLNGASTVWIPSTGFPTVRTDMLQLRAMDGTIIAATHGRGFWTGNILAVLPLNNITLSGSLLSDGNASLTWTATDATPDVKYRLQFSTDGINYLQIAETPGSTMAYKHRLNAPVGYYRVVGIEPNRAPVYSNVIVIKTSVSPKKLFITATPNLVYNSTRVEINGAAGSYQWQLISIDGKQVRTGKGTTASGTPVIFTLNTTSLAPGMYYLKVLNNNSTQTTSLIKQ